MNLHLQNFGMAGLNLGRWAEKEHAWRRFTRPQRSCGCMDLKMTKMRRPLLCLCGVLNDYVPLPICIVCNALSRQYSLKFDMEIASRIE